MSSVGARSLVAAVLTDLVATQYLPACIEAPTRAVESPGHLLHSKGHAALVPWAPVWVSCLAPGFSASISNWTHNSSASTSRRLVKPAIATFIILFKVKQQQIKASYIMAAGLDIPGRMSIVNYDESCLLGEERVPLVRRKEAAYMDQLLHGAPEPGPLLQSSGISTQAAVVAEAWAQQIKLS